MIKKTSSNQPSGRDSECISGAFLKSFSIVNGLKMHTNFSHNPQIIFCRFFHVVTRHIFFRLDFYHIV